jgi:hypothetical protein
MTDTLEALRHATGLTMAKVRPGEVCTKCRDKSICAECPFHSPDEKMPGIRTAENQPKMNPPGGGWQ